MAKLNDLFDQFLSNIEPDDEAVAYAQKAHQPVRDYLKEDTEFGQYFVASFLYGSYKRHTIVGEIKDVDIVVLTNFDPRSEENTPQKVLQKLKTTLARYYQDPENPEYQRRSIRINQPLPNKNTEMTLDIIPAVVITGEDDPLMVPDGEQKEWISSHPKGHIKHTTDLNKEEYSQGRFVPLVKIMKWWWKYQCSIRQPKVERPKPKGFWVECITGENFDRNQQDWADHFIVVLKNISAKYSYISQVPQLQDPGLPGQTIKTSMNLDEFKVFMGAVSDSLKLAILARDEPDEPKSSKLWQKIFGEEFPLYEEDEEKAAKAQPLEVSLASTSHAQQPTWSTNLGRNKVEIKAFVCAPNTYKVLSGLGNDARVVGSGLYLKYVAKTNVHGFYEVHWQVVNTGRHAELKSGLRGNFFKAKLPSGKESANPLVNWERSEYTGKHWIECFIVKDGQLVARSGRFYVKIKNPNF
jgi:hypothetical protein